MINKDLSNLVDRCVMLVDNARGEYEDSDELRGLLYLVFLSFILFYGEKIMTRLYDVFSNTFIYCEDDYFVNIINKYTSELERKMLINKNLTENVTGLSFYGNGSNKILLSVKSFNNVLELFEAINHEFNHIFVGSKFKVVDGAKYIVTGFAYEFLSENCEREFGGMEFNESINSLVAEEMVRVIINTSRFNVRNRTVNKLFKKIRRYDNYCTTSYSDWLYMFRDFYDNEKIKQKIKSSLVSNNYQILESYVNSMFCDENWYDNFVNGSSIPGRMTRTL